MRVCAVTLTLRPNVYPLVIMHHFLLLATLLTLASCISFPRAEKARRDHEVLNSKYDPTNANGEGPPIQSRKNFKDRYFR